MKPAGYIVAGGYIIDCQQASILTVSEGMSYGMLITVLMAGYDPAAKTIFDGLLAVVRARPAYNQGGATSKLMEWRLNRDGTGSGAGDGWNAMDGDEDIAMALLMANRQWGSAGRWNYLKEGIDTISAMKARNFNPNGASKGLPRPTDSRVSDYMTGHFKAYQAATGDAFWATAVQKSYDTMNHIQLAYAPTTGLLPDFVINTDSATPQPSPGLVADNNPFEGCYYYNSCRLPWRLATDFVTTNDSRFGTVCGKLMDFLERDSAGDPENMNCGWRLNGALLGDHRGHSFVGPALAGAMVHPRFQTFLNALWTWNRDIPGYGYYDNELQLIPMIVASGNWWNP